MIARAVGVEERQRTVRQRHARGRRPSSCPCRRADLEVRHVAHVERMIGVGIGVAGRARIEVAAGRGEVRLALADRVQVNAVHAGLEAASTVTVTVHDGAGALLCARRSRQCR